MKKACKFIAVLLVIMTAMQMCSPAVVSATESIVRTEPVNLDKYDGNSVLEEEDFSESEYDDIPTEEVQKETVIVCEDQSLRNEYEKHFRTDEGSYVAVSYNEPVHYSNNGIWKEVNNTPKKASDGTYVISESTTPISFPSDIREGYVTISYGKSTVSFGIDINDVRNNLSDGETSVEVETTEQDLSEKSEYEKAIAVDTKHSTLTYSNIFNNGYIEYVTSSSVLKENIVLTDKSDDYTYVFDLLCKSIYPKVTDNGSVYLYEDEKCEKPVMCFTVPYMYDAKGNKSDKVSMQLSCEENCYKLCISADPNWINDESRTFPIVIDPTVELDTGRSDVSDAHVNQNKPTKNYENDYQLEVGKNLNNVFRTYIRYNLPTLPNMSVIADAKIELVQNWARNFSNTDIQLNVYQCTSSWTESGITWNNQPVSNLSNRTIIDYCDYINGMGKHYYLDVTKIVKSWYDSGNNYGLMLATSDETVSEKTSFYSSENAVNAYPVITVTYTNNLGIEDYWDYQSFNLGSSGDICVNTYNGNMTYVHEDVSTSGLIFPLTVSHVYSNDSSSMNGSFENMKFGKGFRLNLIERIEATGLDDYPYRYFDADGTVHFFKSTSTSNIYEMEFDSSTTLYTGSSYVISYDNDKGYKIFNSDGYMTFVIDNNDNDIQITYANGKIIEIYDGASNYVQLFYNADNYLTSIKDYSGRTTTFIYNSLGYLTSINYPDVTSTYYSYTNGMLSQITTATNGVMSISYDCLSNYDQSYYRPEQFSYYDESNHNLKQRTTLNYRTKDTEISCFSGNSSSATDNLVVTYDNTGKAVNFEENGRTVSARKYYNDASSGNTFNKLCYSSDSFTPIPNLHSVSPAGDFVAWTINVDKNVTQCNDVVFYESPSLYMEILDTGPAGMLTRGKDLPVVPGHMYSFSAYVNVLNTLECGYLQMIAEVLDSNENVICTFGGEIINTTDNEWKRLDLTCPMPDGANICRVTYGIFNGTGSFYCESLYSEESDAIGNMNRINESEFTYSTEDKLFTGWTYSCNGVSASSTGGKSGSRALKITGDPDEERSVRQTISVVGNAGDVLIFGASANANCSASGNNNGMEGRFFGIKVRLVKNLSYIQTAYIPFNKDISNSYQCIVGKLTANSDYDMLVFELCYNYEINSAIFDNAFLYRGSFGDSYSYNSSTGKVTSVNDDNGNSTVCTYTGTDLTNVTQKYNNTTVATESYAFDNRHNIISSTDITGVTTTYTYPSSSKGLPTAVTVSSNDGTKHATTTYTYYDNYNYLASVTDPSGSTITYTYDNGGARRKGLVTSVTDGNGNITNFTYDTDNDKLLSTSRADASIGNPSTDFYYSNGRISTVSNSDVTYGINYDSCGRTSEISVEETDIAEYTYNSDNQISNISYANGNSISYEYNSRKLQSGTKYNGVSKYKYYYNNEGRLGRINDIENSVIWDYQYDISGRLISQTGSNNISVKYGYNSSGQNESITVTDDLSSVLTEHYFYDSYGRPNMVSIPTMNSYEDYAYDSMGRVASVTNTYSLNSDITKQYTYKTNGSNETGYIDNVTYNKTTSSGTSTISPTLKYSYDSNGNITYIYENNVEKVHYFYDSLNRLIRENSKYIDSTVLYNYDSSGDILSKTVYNYTTSSSPANPIDTIIYSYDDSNWINGVTDYDGETIVYDANGNPTTYRGYSMTWQGSGQLSSTSKPGQTTSYKYNCDGIRTKKTINSNVTDYLYIGSTLISQTTGNETIVFAYGTDGSPNGFTLNGTKYFYITNIQGDITGIYDSTGTVVVNYVYDSWGKLVSITGSLASSVGVKNPLRYRGYYYDSELEMYYLQSRYYDPETGRFISSDAYLIAGDLINGVNMFAYCCNNPVNSCDPTGKESQVNELRHAVASIILVSGFLGYIGEYIISHDLGFEVLEELLIQNEQEINGMLDLLDLMRETSMRLAVCLLTEYNTNVSIIGDAMELAEYTELATNIFGKVFSVFEKIEFGRDVIYTISYPFVSKIEKASKLESILVKVVASNSMMIVSKLIASAIGGIPGYIVSVGAFVLANYSIDKLVDYGLGISF